MDFSEFLEEHNYSNDRYKDRISSLKEKGFDSSHVENGVESVIEKLSSGAKSFVVYGEPQSGKTEFMIALTCALLDSGKQTIFVVMNDNTTLEIQNFRRFKEAPQINPTPMRHTEFMDLREEDKKTQTQRVIFCRKNSKNLEKLITETRFLKDRVVIDDEADYASPNSKIKKEQQSQINLKVGELGQLDRGGIYIGVTATPGRLDLNNTFANDTDDWVFLTSHEKYIGRRFFFPVSKDDQAQSDFILEKQPEEGEAPQHLENSFLRFLTKVAVRNLGIDSERTRYSMLIHTDGTKEAHRRDKAEIEKFLYNFQYGSRQKREKYLHFIAKYAEELDIRFQHAVDPRDVLRFVTQNIGRRNVLVINSENDHDNVDACCNPRDLFTFAIGGNIVSRGLTFNNLLTFFFSRNVKSKLQQNTYVQRARMFGTRPYVSWLELSIPESLYQDWYDCFYDHELSVQSIMRGGKLHFSSRRTSSADSASIDERHVAGHSGEISPWEMFELTQALKERLRFIKDSPIQGLRELLAEGLLPAASMDLSFLDYLDTIEDGDLTSAAIVEMEGTFFYPLGKKPEINPTTLMRDRGGLVAAIIKGRPKYLSKAHLFLITTDGQRARFIYRAAAKGRQVMKNLISR